MSKQAKWKAAKSSWRCERCSATTYVQRGVDEYTCLCKDCLNDILGYDSDQPTDVTFYMDP